MKYLFCLLTMTMGLSAHSNVNFEDNFSSFRGDDIQGDVSVAVVEKMMTDNEVKKCLSNSGTEIQNISVLSITGVYLEKLDLNSYSMTLIEHDRVKFLDVITTDSNGSGVVACHIN